jgi:hypothetical protein
MSEKKTNFIITKRIAKHGSQSIIVVPRILEQHLKPGMIVELNINIIENKINKEPVSRLK